MRLGGGNGLMRKKRKKEGRGERKRKEVEGEWFFLPFFSLA